MTPLSLFDVFSLLLASAALAFISITMLLRGNDYRRKKAFTRITTVRVIGFIFAGFAPWIIVPYWYLSGSVPNFFETLFYLGTAAVFFTSENLPPWWVLLTRGVPEEVAHDDAR